jgi:hypothetical protein
VADSNASTRSTGSAARGWGPKAPRDRGVIDPQAPAAIGGEPYSPLRFVISISAMPVRWSYTTRPQSGRWMNVLFSVLVVCSRLQK